MNTWSGLRYRLSVDLVGRSVLRLRRLRAERRAALRPTTVQPPPFRAAQRHKELVARHWLQARHADLTRKVAWVTSGAPVELLTALGYFVIYPENHAALCGSARVSVDIASQAESAGYSRDLCSYARTDIGAMLSGKTPVGRLPKPDLLMACTNVCQTVLYWYRVLAHHFHVPVVLIDTPFLYGESAPDHALAFVQRQIEDAVPIAEAVAGETLDEARLRQALRLSRDASQLWLELMERNRSRPAPMTVFDQFILMAPIVELRGEASTVEFYAGLLKEVDERIANGVGAVPDERHRLLWDNLPIWYRIRYLSELFAGHGAALVASTYTNAWGELAPWMDPERPFESLARTYTYPILNRGAGHKLATMKGMIDSYHLDGAILHSDRSCKPYSMGQMDERDRLIRDCGVPALLLEADHNDTRIYAEEQVANRLAAFFEMME